ncbi:integrase [Sinorhizobium terangae]|nr:integrase [Sinorhizobium terangae]
MLLIGRPVTVLKRWLAEAGIKEGPVFRRIDQWGNLDRRALTPQSVNLILKARCKQVGLDPALFSAHGLRSGYFDRGGKPRHSAAGGDAASTAQVGGAGGAPLQQC